MLKKLHIEAIEQAAHSTVSNFPGGAHGILASDVNQEPKLEKQPHVLLNEVNPTCERHKLGLVDATRIQEITGDYSILLAVASHLNHTVVPLSDQFQLVDDMELLNTFTKWAATNGDVSLAVNHALEDRRITTDEYKLIREHLIKAVQAGFTFLNRLEAVVDAE